MTMSESYSEKERQAKGDRSSFEHPKRRGQKLQIGNRKRLGVLQISGRVFGRKKEKTLGGMGKKMSTFGIHRLDWLMVRT